jgi:precorrin-6B methylase 2
LGLPSQLKHVSKTAGAVQTGQYGLDPNPEELKMKRLCAIRLSSVMLGFALFAAGGILAQEPQSGYRPTVGQPGKDVVWVPTEQDLVEKMLDLAKVTPQDFVIDLGSGDGRTVIAAAKRGARSLGIEYNPNMVELSQRNAAEAGISEKATFVKADLFETDFSKATVLTMFLLPDINIKLRPKILAMKPGTRVVSNSFTMEDWNPDEDATVESGCTSWCTAYLWIVPARVEGKWRLLDGELELEQRFQVLSGALVLGGKRMPITGKLKANKISFLADKVEYEGQVDGDTIALKAADTSLTATRQNP